MKVPLCSKEKRCWTDWKRYWSFHTIRKGQAPILVQFGCIYHCTGIKKIVSVTWDMDNSLPDNKILDFSKLKAFTEDNKQTKKKGASGNENKKLTPFLDISKLQGISRWRIKCRLHDLTLSQTTNFRLFWNERVCGWQYWILCKRKKVFQMVRKHCGKRRNCSFRAISPFTTVFSKDLYFRHIKTRACLGKS